LRFLAKLLQIPKASKKFLFFTIWFVFSGNGTEDDRNGGRQHDRKGVEGEIAGGKLVYKGTTIIMFNLFFKNMIGVHGYIGVTKNSKAKF
jgi:hypothetical protein